VTDMSFINSAVNFLTGRFAPAPTIDAGPVPGSAAVPRLDVYKAARTTLLSEVDLGSLGVAAPILSATTQAPAGLADLDEAIGLGSKGKGKAKGHFKHYDKLDEKGRKAYDDLESSGTLHKPDKDGNSVFSLIEGAADAVLGAWMKGMETLAVISQLLVDLANPASIFQGEDTDTCTASAVQQLLAASEPIEYVRIGLDLSISGGSTCKGGQRLSLDEKSFEGDEGRSALSDAFQGAFMLLGRSLPPGEDDGSVGLLFRSATRVTYAGDGDPDGPVGLTGAQFNGLLDALTGQDYLTVEVGEENQAQALVELQRALKEGPVPTVLAPPDGSSVGHAVMVSGIQNGMVELWDPGLGQATSMSLEDFLARLDAVNLPPAPVAEAEKLRNRVVANDRYKATLSRLNSAYAGRVTRSIGG